MRRQRQRVGTPVYLNVYDLNPINDTLITFGLGLFHSGVEVHGKEFSFGENGGVFENTPKEAPPAIFRTSILLGETRLGYREVDELVGSLRQSYPGSSYDVMRNNCNCFSRELSERLITSPEDSFPGWVNRMADFGSCLSSMLEPLGVGGAYVPAPDATTVFRGEGRTLGGRAKDNEGREGTRTENGVSSGNDGEQEGARRRRHREARLRRLAGSSKGEN